METNENSNSKLKVYDSIEDFFTEKKEIEKKINTLIEDFMTKYDANGYYLTETVEGKFERCLFEKNELPLILNMHPRMANI